MKRTDLIKRYTSLAKENLEVMKRLESYDGYKVPYIKESLEKDLAKIAENNRDLQNLANKIVAPSYAKLNS